MNLIATYDRAFAALTDGLKAMSVDKALASRDDLGLIKLRAKQVRDRELLAKATEFEMRVTRRLGELLDAARQAGHLREGTGRPSKLEAGAALPPATLKEIGVDKKLSVMAQRAAALDVADFEDVVREMHTRMASGKAILVDPIQHHEKSAELDGRRAAHAARTVNGGTVKDLGELALSGKRFGSIGSDPQWKFLTRSAEGDGRSANVHYKTEEVDRIKQLPVGELAAENSAFYMWAVDWCLQDALDLIAHYGFKHITTAFTWAKLNASGVGWHMGQGYWTRANPEVCLFATKGNPKRLYADVEQLIVAPVMEHSRKPDEYLDCIERLTEGDYLELQARRPRKGWTSWGDELEFTGEAA
jgi:N6-adenosine-specific RNA methylase IME4